jgi:hypothetical protein
MAKKLLAGFAYYFIAPVKCSERLVVGSFDLMALVYQGKFGASTRPRWDPELDSLELSHYTVSAQPGGILMAQKNVVLQSGIILAVVLALIALSIASNGSKAATGMSDLPEGLVKGARVNLVYHGRRPEIWEVKEVHGTWVRATTVEAEAWNRGSEVWVNLGAVDQLTVAKPAAR